MPKLPKIVIHIQFSSIVHEDISTNRHGRSCRHSQTNFLQCDKTQFDADLLVEVVVELLPGDLHVGVGVDLLEDVDGRGSVGDVEELDVEVEGGAARDHVAGALLAVTQLRRHNQLPLLADAHALDALVPTADHLLKTTCSQYLGL